MPRLKLSCMEGCDHGSKLKHIILNPGQIFEIKLGKCGVTSPSTSPQNILYGSMFEKGPKMKRNS